MTTHVVKLLGRQAVAEREQENRNFHLVATMTDIGKSGGSWHGESGHVNEALLKRVAAGLAAPIYYVVGPPAMTQAIRQLLNRVGVNDDDVRSEDFAGY